jgi:hypothetical protein
MKTNMTQMKKKLPEEKKEEYNNLQKDLKENLLIQI